MTRIRRGAETYFQLEVRDMTTVPTSLIDPDGGVFLTLFRPNGATALALAPMTKVSTGIYMYRFQTNDSDPLGVWSMDFKALNGTSTHRSIAMGAFELVI